MADIKTHLRELSVAFGVYAKLQEERLEVSMLTPRAFYDICSNAINNKINIASNILEISQFNKEHYEIISNGVKLANLIIDKLPNIDKHSEIYWYGYDTQKENPIDLSVGQYNFSLKEESFILENMGLYKYLNLLTNSNYKRGIHVFGEFAPVEYNEWFNYSWNRLLSYPQTSWTYNAKSGYSSSINKTDKTVEFNYNDKEKVCLPADTNLTIEQYTKKTNSTLREKVFSKWISDVLQNDEEYIKIKNKCSIIAGQLLVNTVKENLNPKNIERFLQVYDTEYYYAKSTKMETKLFRVPSKKEFNSTFKVQNIEYSVPSSQLNIKTTIKNIKNNKELVIRNECRFSHGQFNGTPEAKMYYERGNDLSAIYEEIG